MLLDHVKLIILIGPQDAARRLAARLNELGANISIMHDLG